MAYHEPIERQPNQPRRGPQMLAAGGTAPGTGGKREVPAPGLLVRIITVIRSRVGGRIGCEYKPSRDVPYIWAPYGVDSAGGSGIGELPETGIPLPPSPGTTQGYTAAKCQDQKRKPQPLPIPIATVQAPTFDPQSLVDARGGQSPSRWSPPPFSSRAVPASPSLICRRGN
jgi:hypothetical protein